MSGGTTQLFLNLRRHVPAVKQYLVGDYLSVSDEERRIEAAACRKASAWAAAGITPLPLPFADIFTVTPVQILMVRAIGNIYGVKLDKSAAKEVFSVVGGGIVGQQVCLALFKIGMPGAGGFGGAAFVWAWTHGMGKAAELYFSRGGTVTPEELAAAREEGVAEARDSEPLGAVRPEDEAPSA